MFTVDAGRIRTLMFERGISGTYELARQAQLNAGTVAKLLRDNAKATAKTIAAIAKLFNVNGNELILKG